MAPEIIPKAVSNQDFANYFGENFKSRDTPGSAFAEVAPVYTCVRVKADALTKMPLVISTDDDQVIESGPVANLVSRPNPRQTSRAFLREVSAYLDLFGRVHWLKSRDLGGRTTEVYNLNPGRMFPEFGKDGQILFWRFRQRVGRQLVDHRILDEDVHTFIDPDFEQGSDLFQGLSPRRAVTNAINQYFASDLANEANLKNGVEPGGAFRTDHQMSETQVRELREQIRDRQGVRNRKLGIVLHGGLEWQQIGAAFKDMEFLNLKKNSETTIFSAYGVPPAVAGIYEDSNYAHTDAADRIFWINTVLPRAAWIAEEFTCGILSEYANDRSASVTFARSRKLSASESKLRGFKSAKQTARREDLKFFAWFDPSGVPAVQQALLSGVEQAEKWNKLGVPLNSLIDAVDAPFEHVAWGDTWFRPMGLIDVRDDITDINDPDGSESIDVELFDASWI